MSATAQRWEIWGRWRHNPPSEPFDREIKLSEVEPFENESDELMKICRAYGPAWYCFLEHFPVVRPVERMALRAASSKPGRPKMYPPAVAADPESHDPTAIAP